MAGNASEARDLPEVQASSPVFPKHHLGQSVSAGTPTDTLSMAARYIRGGGKARGMKQALGGGRAAASTPVIWGYTATISTRGV